MKNYVNILYSILILATILLFICIFFYREPLLNLILSYELKGFVNYIIYSFLILIYFLTPLPITPIILFNGFLFQFQGFLLSYILVFFSSSILFIFSQNIKKQFKLESRIKFFNDKYKLITYSKNSFSIILSRYIFPYFFHNIYYGLINIKYPKFISLVMLAEIPLTFAINSIGISFKTYTLNQTVGLYSLIKDENFYIPVITILIIFFIGKIIRNKI